MFEQTLQERIKTKHPEILESITATNDLTDETKEKLANVAKTLADEMGNAEK